MARDSAYVKDGRDILVVDETLHPSGISNCYLNPLIIYQEWVCLCDKLWAR